MDTCKRRTAEGCRRTVERKHQTPTYIYIYIHIYEGEAATQKIRKRGRPQRAHLAVNLNFLEYDTFRQILHQRAIKYIIILILS